MPDKKTLVSLLNKLKVLPNLNSSTNQATTATTEKYEQTFVPDEDKRVPATSSENELVE